MTAYTGTSGNDTIVGTSGDDGFDMSQGGNDSVSGGGGADYFYFGSALTAADHIDGGDGIDTVELSGNYTDGQTLGHPPYFNQVTFTATTMVNVDNLVLAAGSGNGYTLFFNAATVAAGQLMEVDGTALVSGNTMSIDGSAVGGDLTFYGGTGAYTLKGGSGDDVFHLFGGYTATDKIDGGGGNNSVDLNGNYTDGQTLGHPPYFNQLTFTATTMVNVEDLVLEAGTGNAYTLFLNAATVAAGQTMIVDGSRLESGNSMTVDGSAVAGALKFYDGLGVYTLTGGPGADQFYCHPRSSDTINGSGGSDSLIFVNPGTIASSAFAHVTGIESIQVLDNANESSSIVLTDALVASANGHTLTVTGSAGADTINGAHVTSAGDRLHIQGAGGADTLTAGSGADKFIYAGASDSTSTHYDTVSHFSFSSDRFNLPGGQGTVSAIDSAVTAGALNAGTHFDSNLTAALSGHLGAHDAVLFTASSGTLSGQTFLVVDLNGTAGYQSGHDLVIHLTGETGTLVAGDFI